MKHIRITVTAGAARERVEVKKGVLHIFVKEEARGNMANRRAVQLAAAHWGIALAAIKIVAGHHTPRKTLAINE